MNLLILLPFDFQTEPFDHRNANQLPKALSEEWGDDRLIDLNRRARSGKFIWDLDGPECRIKSSESSSDGSYFLQGVRLTKVERRLPSVKLKHKDCQERMREPTGRSVRTAFVSIFGIISSGAIQLILLTEFTLPRKCRYEIEGPPPRNKFSGYESIAGDILPATTPFFPCQEWVTVHTDAF
ncbi:hypothetical protein BDN72DRAFT_859782 [Pluteus cervinus]|uniref:Uncharacterized protein n=1 Tax=Pluteus cervinus TaxID=181527 RepID=A0ACD3ALX5_9AGAR|nr:hypothetical protein BDN72DRAFT_859782 [Pluteus cervinus]